MKTIYFSPDDVAWMRRRLLGSVHGFAALLVLTSLLQGSSPAPGQTGQEPAPAPARQVALGRPAPIDSPPETAERGRAADAGHAGHAGHAERRRPNPVPPAGWRRTADGWQHVSSWPTARPSINELIVEQRAEEPAWMQGLFHRLRSIPPIGFALFQLVAVALIAAVCERKRLAA